MLSAEAARALDRASASGDLELRARHLVEGLYHGRHRTPHRGASTEFFDFRHYAPGDPIARIDWKLFGRTDRYFIRRFHQDAQLSVTIILDASASMGFASIDAPSPDKPVGARLTKFRRAQELAAALAFLTIRQGDRVGLVVVGAAGAEGAAGPIVVPPATGWPALHTLIDTLERTKPAAASGAPSATLADGFDAASRLLRDRGLVIALGDALEDAEALLGAAARFRSAGRAGAPARRVMRDVALIQVLADDELELPSMASAARFVDPESPASVRTSPHAVAGRYARLIHDHCERLRLGMLSLAGRYVLTTPTEDPVEALRRLVVGR